MYAHVSLPACPTSGRELSVIAARPDRCGAPYARSLCERCALSRTLPYSRRKKLRCGRRKEQTTRTRQPASQPTHTAQLECSSRRRDAAKHRSDASNECLPSALECACVYDPTSPPPLATPRPQRQSARRARNGTLDSGPSVGGGPSNEHEHEPELAVASVAPRDTECEIVAACSLVASAVRRCAAKLCAWSLATASKYGGAYHTAGNGIRTRPACTACSCRGLAQHPLHLTGRLRGNGTVNAGGERQRM